MPGKKTVMVVEVMSDWRSSAAVEVVVPENPKADEKMGWESGWVISDQQKALVNAVLFFVVFEVGDKLLASGGSRPSRVFHLLHQK